VTQRGGLSQKFLAKKTSWGGYLTNFKNGQIDLIE
jgi:hypothetical protein